MKVVNDIIKAKEFLEDQVLPNETVYISEFAYTNILLMEIGLTENYTFSLPTNTRDFLRGFVFLDEFSGRGGGVVRCSRKLAEIYVSIASALLDRGQGSISLLGYLRLLLLKTGFDSLLTIEHRDGLWFLVSSAEFEKIHRTRIFATVPGPSE